MTITINPIPMQGWECPKCRAVFSPTTPQCLNCPGAVGVATNHVCDFPDDVTFPTCRICGAMKPSQFTFTTCQHVYPEEAGTPGRHCYKCGLPETFFTNLDTNTPIMIPSVFYETPPEGYA